jgi:CheY-like chemotaxis protein
MRVLYIDDDRVQGLLFTEACRPLPGVEVETACSAADATAVVTDWQPELLVIDLHMADATGLELLPRLRALSGRRHVPAALCTADEAPTLAAQATAAGFDACWTKPFDMRKLPVALARLLRQMP